MTIRVPASWKVQDAQKQVARRAKAHSDVIDLQIKEDSKRLQRKCDVLLMGSSVLSIQFHMPDRFRTELLYRVDCFSFPTTPSLSTNIACTNMLTSYADSDFILLGCNDHDISTIVRQMKIIHGYTHEERIGFRPTIWKDLLETSRRIVQVLRSLHAEPGTHSSEVRFVELRLDVFNT